MIVGMDVYKDTDSRGKQTVAAFVSSLNGTNPNNLNCTKWYSRCALQPTDQVFCDNLMYFMTGNLVVFKKKLQQKN